MSDSIFPFIDVTDETIAEQTQELPTPTEYAWDFEKNDFILKDGSFVVVEGLEAIKIWIYKTLQTPRFRYAIYSDDYGHDLEDLIGSDFSKAAAESEIKRILYEALMVNPYIESIEDVEVIFDGDTLGISCIVATPYGEVSVNV
ncbi:Protein of unknown function [Caloramator quimbayensis]|uniref:DUF2634 domain-containing protein n=1 Tax=Caloramator quimbayensis TaxID=1147123 RepID=A0A1T4YC16_9CLOT|nr:DUF2634 domain-containing protein [Caloramator quimbayensis]SKA99316.1 Protein of unknown function [Caloramator quimbayensis]